ncbi:MAG: GAF domain-containing protein [Caulobacteraceae bacterium]|nr:GAF domain-containing protein [Caulobacteraceae bacterium]
MSPIPVASLRDLIEALAEPVLILRADARILMTNKAATACFGEMPADQDIRILAPDDAVADDLTTFVRCCARGQGGVERTLSLRGARSAAGFRCRGSVIRALDGEDLLILRLVEAPVGPAAATEAELRRLNWALGAYARSSEALIHSDNLDDAMDGICRAIVANDVYALTWVGLVEPPPSKSIRIVAGAGRAISYLENLELSWSDAAAIGMGPSGSAVRQGRPHILRDALTEPSFAPWRDQARLFDLRSSVTVPFSRGDEVIGAIAVYADRPDAFGPEELGLFEKLAEELAFAIGLQEARARLKAAEEARRAAEEATRETQAELTRVARLLTVGEFASSLAHEINQPIAAIMANSEAALRWLARDVPDIAEACAATQRTIRDAKRAGDIVKRTRAWFANDNPVYAELDINDALEETLRFTQVEQRQAEVTVETDLSPARPRVLGDRIQLQQVMLNLIVNGIDAVKDNADRPRLLKVSSGLTDTGEVLVSVEDNGTGLDPSNTERLFQHFFTTKTGGIGLGLPISRSIIEAHRGRLWASGGALGGALFLFALPALTSPTLASPAQTGAAR